MNNLSHFDEGNFGADVDIILPNISFRYVLEFFVATFGSKSRLVEISLFGCLERIHHHRTYTIKLANSRVHRPRIYFTLSSNLFVGETGCGDLSSLRISRSTLGSARKRVERKRDETKVRRGATTGFGRCDPHPECVKPN